MDRSLSAETSGFAAIVGGLGCVASLPSALHGLAHRHAGRAATVLIAGRELARTEHHGCLCGAIAAFSPPALQASRGLLAVGGGGAAPRGPSPVASGLVADQAVAVSLTGCVHNGSALRKLLVERGALLTQGGQAELLLQLMAQSRQRTLVNRLVEALERVVGGFSLALVADELAVAARDPRGFRPLWIGTRPDGHVAASDPLSLLGLGAEDLRELAPGEVVLLEPGAPVRSLKPWGGFPRAACALEWLFFSRPGASFEGLAVHPVRHRLGRALAAACPVPADVVVSLPGACTTAGLAYAQQAGIPFVEGFDPGAVGLFHGGSEPDLSAVVAAVRSRRCVLVVASDVRPERLRAAVSSLREAGARGVHLRCFGPLLAAACPYGMPLSVPSLGGEVGIDPAALQGWVQADSIAAMDLDGLSSALGRDATGSCTFCVGGAAPLQARDAAATPQLPLFEGGESGA